jgi:3-oxoacyl-[acyl-carrier protein] reductase
MDQFLSNQKAVVTGGTRGIGYAVALGLMQAGADVLICGRTDIGVRESVSRLKSQAGEGAGKVSGAAADVSKWHDVEAMFQFVNRKWNKLDILVNNAGIGIFRSVADLTPEEWHQVIDLNLTGVFYCCHAAIPLLKASGSGYVFNVSSLAGRNPFAGGAAYNASKFGLNGFSEAMMLDHRQDSIRVTTVMPGSVATEFGAVPANDKGGDDWKIQPEDIAQTILDLLHMPKRTLVSRVEVRPSQPPRK